MWNSISNLWGETPKVNILEGDLLNLLNPVEQTSVTNVNNVEPLTTDYILTETSSRDNTPKECSIKLWPHQEAMLHRIRNIEKRGYKCKSESSAAAADRYMDKSKVLMSHEVCLGVMNDPPGSGKTYAILAHILTDTTPGPSIVIVPQNIYGQWRQAIIAIFGSNPTSYKFSNSYADVLDMYSNSQSVHKYKIILLQDSFAEAYLKTLNDNNISVCRIVVDEVDIMDRFVCSAVRTKFVWLMSASYNGQKVLGPYHIGDHTKVVCKCDSHFVEKSLNLPEPNNQIIKCYDDHIEVFRDVLTPLELKSLHAGDLSLLNRKMNKSGIVSINTFKDTIKHYSEFLYKKSEELEIVEKELEKMSESEADFENERTTKEKNLLVDKMSQLRKFRDQSLLLMERTIELPPNLDTLNLKDNIIKNNLVEQILKNKTTKWLFFNDNGNVLIKIQEFLTSKEIKSEMLDGGNQLQIERTLNNYKEGDVQVLLLNSMIEGAGMNLENTTHLVFMHKTEEKFIQQVIGRAQRFGRTAPLNIIMLFNNHE
jgi:hypothetical protein